MQHSRAGQVLRLTAPAPAPEPPKPAPPAPTPVSLVEITAGTLNIRAGAGTNHKITGSVRKGEVFTIVEKSGSWGRLKSGAGWIHLDYTKPAGSPAPVRKSNETIAREVIKGMWGNGDDRVRRLRAAGYDPKAIQSIVNRLI